MYFFGKIEENLWISEIISKRSYKMRVMSNR